MILVTGATGLVGAHLIYELCSRGQRVRATRRSNSNTGFVKWVFKLYTDNALELFELIEWVDAEVLDYQSLAEVTKGVSTVFHTAATVSFSPSQNQNILATNVRGTANVVDACIENGVKTLCHVSSIAALGDKNDKGVIDENCKWQKSKGQSAYARSKFLGENEVWRGYEQGLRTIVVNPSVILGPGRWYSGSGLLFSMVSKGMPFYTSGVTGYVDVRDVAKAMVFLTLDTEINGQRFILNSENLSFKELFSLIAEVSHKKKPFIRIPEALIHILYPLIFIVTMGKISKANLKSAFTKSYYSSDKIKALGFTVTPIAQTIQHMAKARTQS
ncbi:MAG TPA: NAD-dependent epimerase/dehydratase family protein [Bacteroidales bacterium]|nr:NAD-dependent epimerase/dehydratase family protein [Bacteroidales bacterium]